MDSYSDDYVDEQQIDDVKLDKSVPEKANLEHDFYHKPLAKIKEMDRGFQIHMAIAFIVCGICFFIWRAFTVTSGWWFAYPMFAFAISASIHKFAPTNKPKAGIVVVGILNVMLFFTNYIIEYKGGFPWFIYPLYFTLAVFMAVYYISEPEKYTKLKLATHEFLLLNLLLFITWVLTQGFPWFIYPFFILAIPLVIAYVKIVYEEKQIWVYVGVVSIDLGALMFLTWGFSQTTILPWFLATWIPLAVITGLFYYFRKPEVNYTDLDAPKVYDEENPTAPIESSDDYEVEKPYTATTKQGLYPNMN